LPVVLYRRETCFLTLKEAHRLRVFENWVLRKIFVPIRDEVTREWRRLYYEKLYDLYFSSNITRVIKSRRMKCVGSYSTYVGEERCIEGFGAKPKRKRPFGRPRCG